MPDSTCFTVRVRRGLRGGVVVAVMFGTAACTDDASRAGDGSGPATASISTTSIETASIGATTAGSVGLEAASGELRLDVEELTGQGGQTISATLSRSELHPWPDTAAIARLAFAITVDDDTVAD